MINIDLEKILNFPSLPFQHRDLLPEDSGLYFVVVYINNPQLIYIGKTNNINKRWINHHRIPELNLLTKLSLNVDICWLETRVTEEILAKWEQSLIRTLCPILNNSMTLNKDKTIQKNKEVEIRTEICIDKLTSKNENDKDELILSNKPTHKVKYIETVSSNIVTGLMLLQTESSCPQCNSINIKGNGTTSGGKTRKRCNNCGKSWSL